MACPNFNRISCDAAIRLMGRERSGLRVSALHCGRKREDEL